MTRLQIFEPVRRSRGAAEEVDALWSRPPILRGGPDSTADLLSRRSPTPRPTTSLSSADQVSVWDDRSLTRIALGLERQVGS